MPLRRLSSWLAPGRAGFAGIPGLARPRDWHVLARDAIAQCEALVDEVVRAPPTAAVVRLLDNISDTVGAAGRGGFCQVQWCHVYQRPLDRTLGLVRHAATK